MRVLCCLDGTNVGQVSKAIEMLSVTEPPTLGILYEGADRSSVSSSPRRRLDDSISLESPNTRPPTVIRNHKNPGGNGGIGIPGILGQYE